jgi:endonuclease/exonuclease/phosphatase family metal-dependent hydrolase
MQSKVSNRLHLSFCLVALVAASFPNRLAYSEEPAASSQVATESPRELKIMSFNIRFSRDGVDEADKRDNWNDADPPRRERAIRVIREFMPDVLGVQEARDPQVNDLREALPEYDFYGIGRDDGKTGGEYVGIFYRKDRFARSDAGTFWLSDEPTKPGTSFYTVPGAVPRISSWVRLNDKASGSELFVLNTHWDHISIPARRKSAQLIRKQLEELAKGAPAIVMGDFNTPEDSAPFRAIVAEVPAPGRPLLDSYRAVHRERTPEESTFNHWTGTTKGSRIDFILHTAELTSAAAEIVRTGYDGRWPSDHYPVTATLRLDRGE